MESRKAVPMNLFSGQQWRNRHRQETYGRGVGGSEGEMYWERNLKNISTCKIDR